MLNVLGSVAQWEREMMLERQREGIAKAKAERQVQGPEANRAGEDGGDQAAPCESLSMGQIAERLVIGKGSVHRALSS